MKDNFEIEETLAKLKFYLEICLMDDDYKFCKEEYQEIYDYVNGWIKIYAKEKTLLNISDIEIKRVNDLFYSIPFDKYTGIYYFEYIDGFLSKVEYFHNSFL